MTTFLDEIRRGLTARPKTLSPVWFYDTAGSKLFEAITLQPEYYPTETERAILRANAQAIIDNVATPARVAELGAGSSSKTRVLLEALLERQSDVTFAPIDVSAEALRLTRETLEHDYPSVHVEGIEGRNRVAIQKLDWTSPEPWLVLFLGSSIGNLEPEYAQTWLREVCAPMRSGDALVLGIDCAKDKETLERAYNDAAGVTARFNLNLLDRMNREVHANFDRQAFGHKAIYNTDKNRIEMHLKSLKDQVVHIPGAGDITFAKGETIHTENSYKYTEKMVRELLEAAGLRERARYMDERGWFTVLVLGKP